ncbi:MAG: flagellar hook-associated protein FlgK [Bacillota bacterium]
MRTTFGTFNIATSGLFASQRSLDITSHNITNANTEGYSRQSVLQRATMPIGGDPTGILGTGVESYDVIRYRSEYLDQKLWGQNKSYAEWKTKMEGLQGIEAVFNEPSDTGIRKVMDDFFISLEELIKKSGDSTNRVAVIEKAGTLAATINRMGHEVLNNIRDTNFAIKNKVSEINSIASQITVLNKQIFNMELGKHRANDLRDQRNLLVDKLSSLVNIEVSENFDSEGNGYFRVGISGITLLEHYNVNKIDIDNQDLAGITDIGGGKISKVKWVGADGNLLDEVKIEAGELKGLMDIRDGNGKNNSYRGLPFYLDQLNRFARDFTREFNLLHNAGFDLNGAAGTDFFDEPVDTVAPIDATDDWKNVNCVNMKVRSTIIANPSLIAASSASGGESNNENAKLLSDLRNKRDIFYASDNVTRLNGTPDDFIKSFLSALSVDANQAKRLTENTEAIVKQTESKRLSETGVSLDEEMSNMVKFQHAYNASARMITSLDKVLDTMINRLGLVGR